MTTRLVLASASPARLATLRRAGVRPEVIVSGVDEDDVPAGTPAEHAAVLAARKAQAVAARVTGQAYVLGCDSVLEHDGEVHGKPVTPERALERWRRLRGSTGVLHTGHCLIEVPSGRSMAAVASTVVRFSSPDDEDIAAYVATSEPLRVAGAFTIDGLGAAFVEGVDGDPHNVVGVSLPLLRRLLADLGVRWTDLWERPDPAG